MTQSMLTNLKRHASIGYVLMAGGGALAIVLYALLALLATPTLMHAAPLPIATLLKQCLWTLVGALSGLALIVLGYLYQQMLSRYQAEVQLQRTLGLPLWYLAVRLILENVVWAVLTSGIGIAVGIIGSKFFVMWLFRMMSLPLNPGLLWSSQAARRLLTGYTLGYCLLAVSGWFRFCHPLDRRDRYQPTTPTRLNHWWQWLLAILAPFALAGGTYGLTRGPAAPPLFSAGLSLSIMGIFAMCAFTLPASLALLARLPSIRQRATRLLGVTTSRQLFQRHWLTMGLTSALLSGAITLLLSGLIQYQALHTATAPLPFLSHLVTVDGVGIDAAAGITLFTTTMISFAMMVAAAMILGLVKRLTAGAEDHATTLYQLGMPRPLIERIKHLQGGLVAGLPLVLGILNAAVILAAKMPVLKHQPNSSWFILTAALLYVAVVRTVGWRKTDASTPRF